MDWPALGVMLIFVTVAAYFGHKLVELVSQKIWITEKSIVQRFNDLAMYDGDMERINRCKSCKVLYSDYVRYRNYPCPRCGCEDKKEQVYAKLFGNKEVRWEIVDNFGNLYSSKVEEVKLEGLEDLEKTYD